MEIGPLDALVGGELDTVSFVRDYVELRINDAIVRAFTPPSGCVSGVEWTFDEPGAADLMRGYIDQVVASAEVVENEQLTLMFVSGDRFVVSLREDDRKGWPEAAHFVPWVDGGLDLPNMLVW